jgi:hypothetical protein
MKTEKTLSSLLHTNTLTHTKWYLKLGKNSNRVNIFNGYFSKCVKREAKCNKCFVSFRVRNPWLVFAAEKHKAMQNAPAELETEDFGISHIKF